MLGHHHTLLSAVTRNLKISHEAKPRPTKLLCAHTVTQFANYWKHTNTLDSNFRRQSHECQSQPIGHNNKEQQCSFGYSAVIATQNELNEKEREIGIFPLQ